MSDILMLAIGLLVGALLGWLIGQLRAARQRSELTTDAERERSRVEQLERELDDLRQRLHASEEREVAKREEASDLQSQVAGLKQALQSERETTREKLALLGEAKEELGNRFKALSSEILQRSGEQLAKQHQERLQQTIKPLNEGLERFQKQVEKAYDSETRERASLKEQLKNLTELNQRISQEADQLARALKGQSKARGDWGEMMLERILQHSGLRENEEYRLQASFSSGEEGRRLQPDVIIDLPDRKSLVIDAKLSLISWMECVESNEEVDQAAARKRLVEAMRGHMRDLDGKRYQQLYELETVDFVLMFIPIEAAFVEALTADPQLYQDAFDRNVVLVSPSTLMAVLRTVASTWRHDRQERNAIKIADAAGKMYDQFVSYIAVFEEIGKRLDQAQGSFDTARKRLVEGRGNLVKRAEDVRKMGAKVAKRLGRELGELAAESERALPEPDESDDESES